MTKVVKFSQSATKLVTERKFYLSVLPNNKYWVQNLSGTYPLKTPKSFSRGSLCLTASLRAPSHKLLYCDGAHRIRCISNVRCKLGIGHHLLARKVEKKIWKQTAVRFRVFDWPMTILHLALETDLLRNTSNSVWSGQKLLQAFLDLRC